MSLRNCVIAVFLSAIVSVAACSKSNPVAPTSPTAAVDPSLTASVATPRPISPANGAAIPNLSQPVTLTVLNAIVTQPGGTTYSFEVATDSAFTAKVQTKDGVAEGSGGQTSLKLDALAPAKDYFWHARATAGGTVGVFGVTYKLPSVRRSRSKHPLRLVRLVARRPARGRHCARPTPRARGPSAPSVTGSRSRRHRRSRPSSRPRRLRRVSTRPALFQRRIFRSW